MLFRRGGAGDREFKRDEGGKFSGDGTAREPKGDAKAQARQRVADSIDRAHAASGSDAPAAHKEAAEAHRALAEHHKEALKGETDEVRKGDHSYMIERSEREAEKHDKWAEESKASGQNASAEPMAERKAEFWGEKKPGAVTKKSLHAWAKQAGKPKR